MSSNTPDYQRAWRAAHGPWLWQKAASAAARASDTATRWAVDSGDLGKEVFARLHLLPCASCGAMPALSADHIVPFSGGGQNTIDNLQPMCRSCNQRKSGPRPNKRFWKTVCRNGHPYDEANTRWRPDGKTRTCRACHRNLEYARRNRVAATKKGS